MNSTQLSGMGLHSGRQCTVRLTCSRGVTSLSQNGVCCALDALSVTRTDFGVSVSGAGDQLRVDLVEHLFAALAVLQLRSGLRIEVLGPELPLLDGGSARWLAALRQLGLWQGRPSHRITRPQRYTFGPSWYQLSPATGIDIEVDVDFRRFGLGQQSCRYRGELEQFQSEIAGARTFGFLQQADYLRSIGRAQGVDPDSVLVFTPDGSTIAGQHMRTNELAAHKLLDLLGDSLLYGALPEGKLVAHRPGHTANHAMLKQALADGVIQPLAFHDGLGTPQPQLA